MTLAGRVGGIPLSGRRLRSRRLLSHHFRSMTLTWATQQGDGTQARAASTLPAPSGAASITGSCKRCRSRPHGTGAVTRARNTISSVLSLSVGESWSKGIGNLPRRRGRSPLPSAAVSVGAAPSLRAPEVDLTLASRLAATCDTGSGAGGRASAFRTAQASVPAPWYAIPKWRHGLMYPPPLGEKPAFEARTAEALSSSHYTKYLK